MTEGKDGKRFETDLPESVAASELAIQESTGNVDADLGLADAK
jgi:hypothetical protein